MALVDILLLVIVVGGGLAAYSAWRRQALVRELRAASPPGAMVRPDDPLEVVQAKNRTWAMLEEAVRIFHLVLGQDCPVFGGVPRKGIWPTCSRRPGHRSSGSWPPTTNETRARSDEPPTVRH